MRHGIIFNFLEAIRSWKRGKGGMCRVWEDVHEKERPGRGEADRQSPGTDKELLHVAGTETVADKS